eukprot:GHUV01013726.1.p1 GENE.GHUV01013726.1~~GHUV01013726.1.p1  ORF type:complete len:124 (-),score=14.01 GHUV01013726.1:803-1174(-)
MTTHSAQLIRQPWMRDSCHNHTAICILLCMVPSSLDSYVIASVPTTAAPAPDTHCQLKSRRYCANATHRCTVYQPASPMPHTNSMIAKLNVSIKVQCGAIALHCSSQAPLTLGDSEQPEQQCR